jgi:hypothetical protein
MNRLIRGWLFVGIVGIASVSVPAPGQEPPRPAAMPASGYTTGALGSLVQQMSDRVRQLGDAIEADLGNTPSGPTLLRDTRELAQAITEFRLKLPDVPNAIRGRQLYSGIDASWHYLLVQLGRPAASSGRVGAAMRLVSETDAEVHKALGANAYPSLYYGSQASPGGMPEIQLRAHALVDRAEAMLGFVRADMGGPVGSRLAEEVNSLAEAADAFHDGIRIDSRPDDLTRNGFAGVIVASDLVAADLQSMTRENPVSDRIRSAWQSYRTAETLMRQMLKLPIRQADPVTSPIPTNGLNGLRGAADRLVAQTDDFLIVFTPEARNVREGGYFIADARRLRAAAADFRSAISRALDTSDLAFAFRDVDSFWQVLARRTNRIAPGEGGPNVQRLEGIWQSVGEIHRTLGMPGFPTPVGPLAVSN